MAAKAVCKWCGKESAFPDALVGKQAPCPSCGTKVVVAAAPSGAALWGSAAPAPSIGSAPTDAPAPPLSVSPISPSSPVSPASRPAASNPAASRPNPPKPSAPQGGTPDFGSLSAAPSHDDDDDRPYIPPGGAEPVRGPEAAGPLAFGPGDDAAPIHPSQRPGATADWIANRIYLFIAGGMAACMMLSVGAVALVAALGPRRGADDEEKPAVVAKNDVKKRGAKPVENGGRPAMPVGAGVDPNKPFGWEPPVDSKPPKASTKTSPKVDPLSPKAAPTAPQPPAGGRLPLPPVRPTPTPPSFKEGADRTGYVRPERLADVGVPAAAPPRPYAAAPKAPSELVSPKTPIAPTTAVGKGARPAAGKSGGPLVVFPQEGAAPWSLKPDGRPEVAVEEASMEAVDFNTVPEYHQVLLGSGKKPVVVTVVDKAKTTEVAVFSTPEGEKTSSFTIRDDCSGMMAADADAGLFAYASEKRDLVVLLRLSDGKEAGRLQIPPAWIGRSGKFQFAGPKTIVWHFGAKSLVWTVGKPAAKLLDWGAHVAPSPTPGGKYLVLLEQDKMTVRDALSGQVRATAPMPPGMGVPEEARFSEDGEEFIFWARRGTGEQTLYVVDFASGRFLQSMEVVGEGSLYLARPEDVVWLPDRSGWILDCRFLLSRETGVRKSLAREARGIAASGFQGQMLPSRRLIAKRLQGYGMLVVPIRVEEAAAPAEAAARPSAESDAAETAEGAPAPLREADWSVALAVSTERPDAWAVRPDPSNAAQVDDLLKFSLSGDADELLRVAICAAQGQAFVQSRSETRTRPGASKLRVHELDGGRAVIRRDLPAGATLEAVSPSGDFYLTRDDALPSRIDVWKTLDGAGVAACRPFLAAGPKEGGVEWCGFVDDETLWTLSAGNRLVCWKLPLFKAVCVYDGPISLPVHFTPGRKSLAFFTPTGLRFLDAWSGDVLGEAAAPGGDPLRSGFSFAPDGAYAAVCAEGRVRFVDLKTGEVDAAEGFSPISRVLQRGDVDWIRGSVLLAESSLLGVDRRAPLWHYTPSFSRIRIADAPRDGRRWCIVAADPKSRPTLAAVPLPHPAALAALGKLPVDPPPLLGRGAKVALQWDCRNLPDLPKIQKRVEQQLAAAGVEVVPDALLVLRFSLGKELVEVIHFFDPRSGQPPQQVRFATADASVRLVDVGNDSTQWQDLYRCVPNGFVTKDPEDLSDPTLRYMKYASAYFEGIVLPRKVFAQTYTYGYAVPGLGVTKLDPEFLNALSAP